MTSRVPARNQSIARSDDSWSNDGSWTSNAGVTLRPGTYRAQFKTSDGSIPLPYVKVSSVDSTNDQYEIWFYFVTTQFSIRSYQQAFIPPYSGDLYAYHVPDIVCGPIQIYGVVTIDHVPDDYFPIPYIPGLQHLTVYQFPGGFNSPPDILWDSETLVPVVRCTANLPIYISAKVIL